jgi:hypothetical protein
MTSFIARIIETFLLGYSIWVLFCVVTQTGKDGFTEKEFKENLLLPLRFFKTLGTDMLDKLERFFKNNI